PTREKLGWTNDAQSSAEQVLTDFKAERVLGKWLQDVYDAMRADGALPGIIPTAGWGFDWGNGPVSEGLLFELPYRLYLHTGDKQPLLRSRAYFDRYFAYIDGRTDADGFVRFGLDDWARPQFETPQDVDLVPLELINALLVREFYRIAALAARLDGADDGRYLARGEQLKQLVRRHYVDANGRCTSQRQTSVAMLIYYDVCDDNAPLAAQLKELVEQHGFRHDCGMVGMRRLFYALNKVGLQEYAYRILTSSGMPSYREWFEQDATTLWEYWPWQRRTDSKNHHMYSDFMSWMVKTILGVECAEPGFAWVKIAPYFFEQLDHAEGHCETAAGDVRVCWKREPDGVKLHFEIPQGMTACYGGKELGAGVYDFTV
ncbi:MAG: hypothetical protein IJC25_01020, partial [Clostridia bacterium]|nr:hypothetical protein [Clostridia bacterium]